YRLYVQHLCDPRLALALFLARKPDEPLHLSEDRTRSRTRLCWNQDDRRRLFPIAEWNFTRRDRTYSCCHHYDLDDRDTEPDQDRESKMKRCVRHSKFV